MTNNQEIISTKANYLHNARQVFEGLDVQDSTRKDYQYRIGLFADFVAKEGFHQNTFLQFKRYLASRNDYSVSTKNKYLITAKVFLRELHRTVRTPNITENVRTFSQNKRHKVDGLNNEEMQVLTLALQRLSQTGLNLRLKAIISLLALQGLREVEVTRLDVKDLDLVNKTANVLGKGEDDKQLVHLHPETTKVLQEHLKQNKISSGPVFTSQSNNSRNHRLTTRALRRLVTDFLLSLGIVKTPHGFRHFFTTTLINSYKGDLLTVAQYTRHKTLEMLQVYNDGIKRQADLPRYYRTFANLEVLKK